MRPSKPLLISLLALLLVPAAYAAKPDADSTTTSGGQHQGGPLGWGFYRVSDEPGLPRVLLVGDSIANGYHHEVAQRLKGKANLDLYITPLHIAAPDYQGKLTEVLENGPYAVIHFNESGLHAWVKGRVPEGRYGPLFAEAIGVLRAGSPKARLIWASNTPATVEKKPGVLDEELEKTITDMNTAARAVAEKEGMAIDDLHALMSDKLNLAVGDRWHWTGKGTAVQAEAVTDCILKALEEASQPKTPAKGDDSAQNPFATPEKSPVGKPGSAPAPARVNTAVIPATQPGNGYNWMERHNAIMKVKAELNPDLLLIGDSITHFFGGEPASNKTPSDSHPRTGDKVLKTAFAGHRVLNLGFGSDRTQQVLWRLDHGELEGLKPKWVVINIGTNNTSDGQTAEEILAGVQAICGRVKKQTPDAKIILMAIFPRDNPPTSPRRRLIDAINSQLADYARNEKFAFLDIHAKFLDEHGAIPRQLMPDLCHPTEKGYQIWADALLPLLQ